MLVLSRYNKESIFIGGEVCVTVVEIRSDTVKIGIDAPRWMPVNREEIDRRIEESLPGTRESNSYQAIVEYGFHVSHGSVWLKEYFENPDDYREFRRTWWLAKKGNADVAHTA